MLLKHKNLLRRLGLVAFLPLLCLCLALTLPGCSDSDDGEVVYTHASILVTHDITTRSVSSAVTNFQFTGYNENGQIEYGPVTYSRAQQILLQAIPVSVTSMSIGYYNSNDLVGYYVEKVSLAAGVTAEITDPAWSDIDDLTGVSNFRIYPEDLRVTKGAQAHYRAFAKIKDTNGNVVTQDCSRAATWTSSDENVASAYDSQDTSDRSALTGGYFNTWSTGKGVKISATFAGETDSVDLEVTDATVSSIAMDSDTMVLPSERGAAAVGVTATWSDGVESDITTQCTWTTSDADIATVHTGIVYYQGASASPATISARYSSGDTSYSATCEVTCVEAAVTKITLTLDPSSIAVGGMSYPVVMGHFVSLTSASESWDLELFDNEYELTCPNTGIAEIVLDEDGDVDGIKGLAAGKATISAQSVDDEEISSSADLTVTAAE